MQPTQEDIQRFIERFYPVAQEIEQEYGMPAWAILAQAAHESNWGISNIAKTKNNLMGYGGGGDKALAFNTPEESMRVAARVQMAKAEKSGNQWMNQRYAPTATILGDRNNPPESTFGAMQQSGYAQVEGKPDPNYARSLLVRYNQLQPYINQQPQTKGAMIQPTPTSRPVSTKIPDWQEGRTRIYNQSQRSNYDPQAGQQADQDMQRQRSQQESQRAIYQPGFTMPQPPPSDLNIPAIRGVAGQIGRAVGGWLGGIGNKIQGK